MSAEHRSFVNSLDKRSADYVVAHAARQAKRGKGPSVAYKDELNSRAALEMARQDMTTRENQDEATQPYSEMAGRVAMLHVVNKAQGDNAVSYGEHIVNDLGAVAYEVKVAEPDYDRSRGMHPNEDGTFDVSYYYA